MYRVRLFLRLLFAVCGLGVAVAAMQDLATVRLATGLASLGGGNTASEWAAIELGGWIVIAAAVVGSLLALSRPRFATKILAGGGALGLLIGLVTVWQNMQLWGAALAILAMLVWSVKRPARATPRCPRCGEDAVAGDRFCERCGQPLGALAAAPQVV